MIFALFLALAAPSLSTPRDTYRALQKAAAARDVEAIAAVLAPEERAAFRNEVAKSGVDDVAGRLPKDVLTMTSETADEALGQASGRTLRFVRRESRWYVASLFEKPKEPVAKLQLEPSVRVEKGEVVTVAPIHGAGMPTESAIAGAKAYDLLRARARELRPGARLYTFGTDMSALSAEGKSSAWNAEFLTEKPGEMLTLSYEEGKLLLPWFGEAPPGRDGVPEPDAVGYDTKMLYDETMARAARLVNPISRVTAALYRSAGSGKALWMMDVWGDDDRIAMSVVFEARTMTFSHQTAPRE